MFYPTRTDKEVIKQTNQLAREFYRRMGYRVSASHKFYDFNRENYHPDEKMAWDMACTAQEILRDTHVDDALANEDLL